MLTSELWDACGDFHGHKCPGLAIGFKAVEGAVEELGLDIDNPSIDEELVCVTENDACSTDAVQRLLGCTYGKGNLIPRLRGKMAFSFFDRLTGRGVRLCLKPRIEDGKTRDEAMRYLLEHPYTELFDISKPSYALPEQARLFNSQLCTKCGEETAEYALRFQNRQPVCLDCYDAYQREGF